jgi:hypothetical protein
LGRKVEYMGTYIADSNDYDIRLWCHKNGILMNAVIYIQTAKDELKHLALAEQEKAEFLMRRDSYEQGL